MWDRERQWPFQRMAPRWLSVACTTKLRGVPRGSIPVIQPVGGHSKVIYLLLQMLLARDQTKEKQSLCLLMEIHSLLVAPAIMTSAQRGSTREMARVHGHSKATNLLAQEDPAVKGIQSLCLRMEIHLRLVAPEKPIVSVPCGCSRAMQRPVHGYNKARKW